MSPKQPTDVHRLATSVSSFPHLWKERMCWADLWDYLAQDSIPFCSSSGSPAKFYSSAGGSKWKKTWLWGPSVKEGLMEVSFKLWRQGGGGFVYQEQKEGRFWEWEPGLGKYIRFWCWAICLLEVSLSLPLILSLSVSLSPFLFLFSFFAVNLFVRDNILTCLYFSPNQEQQANHP